jgi:hypothetical protein
MGDVLKNVAALLGVTIDIPAGAYNERMPVVDLGPGQAREVLAALLSDSTLDYLIQDSSVDPNRIQNVVLVTREKKTAPPGAGEMAHATRSPFSRAAASAKREDVPAPDTPAPAPPDNAGTEAAALNPQPEQVPPMPEAPPDQSGLLSTSQAQSSSQRPGALTPPLSLTPQSINQQLQQMYQQRMQMIQQGQAGTGPGSKQL